MAKKNNNVKYVVLLIILVIIVVGYRKYGGAQDEGVVEPADTGADDTGAADTDVDDTTPPVPERKTTQTLYPDLCYAEGGTPRNEEMGCRAGEVSIGEVPGFKTPYICCVD